MHCFILNSSFHIKSLVCLVPEHSMFIKHCLTVFYKFTNSGHMGFHNTISVKTFLKRILKRSKRQEVKLTIRGWFPRGGKPDQVWQKPSQIELRPKLRALPWSDKSNLFSTKHICSCNKWELSIPSPNALFYPRIWHWNSVQALIRFRSLPGHETPAVVSLFEETVDGTTSEYDEKWDSICPVLAQHLKW